MSWKYFHNYITMYLSWLVFKIKDISPHRRQRCIVAEFSSTAKTYLQSDWKTVYFTFSHIIQSGKNWHCYVACHVKSPFERITIFVYFSCIYFIIGPFCQSIVVDGWAGASNPHPLPPHRHTHTLKHTKTSHKSQYCCGRVSRGSQPPSPPIAFFAPAYTISKKNLGICWSKFFLPSARARKTLQFDQKFYAD